MPNETNPPKTLITSDGGKEELNKDDLANWQLHAVIQIDPAHDSRFGGCFLQVTERRSWGVIGYVAIPGDDGGQAYYRLPWEGGSFVGRAEFILKSDEEQEPPNAQ